MIEILRVRGAIYLMRSSHAFSTFWGFKPLNNQSSTLASYCSFSAYFIDRSSDSGSRLLGSSSTFVVTRNVLSCGKHGLEIGGGGIVGKCAPLYLQV
jgi:hypothetical protein